jgi:hypothetical protein
MIMISGFFTNTISKYEDVMRKIFAIIFIITLSGCSIYQIEKETHNTAQSCLGSTNLPEYIANKFVPIEDKQFLSKALGITNEGKLCQGKVYTSKVDTQITIFRAWNSTNPESKFGKWWVFQEPAGKISEYRSEYEICYQWSPLDKLVRCSLKPEIKVVIGTGQSAECSEYLTYPVSDKLQLYLDDASMSVTNCTIFDGEFSWK